MKVLQINSVCGIGSTGRIATDIYKVLKEEGHDGYIAFGRDFPKSCDAAIRIGSKFDNYRHVAMTKLFDRHGFSSKKATRDFLDKVEGLDPDVIHLHNIHGYYINVELLFEYLKRANKPVIWTMHDCWPFTGHCSYFDYANCDKWKTKCYSCPQKKEYPTSVFMDNSIDNYKRKKEIFTGIKNMTIVTPSNWLAELVKESFLKEYPIRVINNGIDLDVFKPTKGDFREKHNLKDKFIILGVANIWEKRKGYEYFLSLSKQLKKDEAIVMVGVTEKQKNQLPSNIVGITRTSNVEELAEIYSVADVFINPTLEDNFPTTNLEALACGTPVITFNTGGSVESVNKNPEFVVEKGNFGELLDKIDRIKKMSKLSYSEKCLERSASLYNKKDRFKEYIELYKESVKK